MSKIVDAEEGLEVTESSSFVDSSSGRPIPSSSSSSSRTITIGSASDLSVADPITHKEIEEVIEQYSKLAERFMFDKAYSYVEGFKHTRLGGTEQRHTLDHAWIALLSSLSQVALCDRNYYLLSFLQTRAFFRKENALKNQYILQAENLQKASEDPLLESMSVAKHLLEQFRRYVLARIEMITFYTTISYQVNRDIQWSLLSGMAESATGTLKTCFHPILSKISNLLAEEIDIVKLLISAQMHIAECRMFESLLNLKEVRERFDFWVKTIDEANPSSSTIGNIINKFRTSEKSSKNRLITWLIQFYNLLMAKFSLYFTNVLAMFCSEDDIKTIHTIDNGFNFISNASHFVRKTEAQLFCIVLDRSDIAEDEPFYGLGYHRLQHRFTHGALLNPLSGPAATCPLVFKMSLLCMMDKENKQQTREACDRFHAIVAEFIVNYMKNDVARSKVFYYHDAANQCLLMGEHLEGNVYMVALYKESFNEKESYPRQFMQDLSNSLRGSRLIHGLKNCAR